MPVSSWTTTVALTATLAKQTDRAPAQYQFKHLSFQEGLYAEHLLMLVTSLAPPQGQGWQGWASDQLAANFLNNRYMNNTCRIAAGFLGGLLALLGRALAPGSLLFFHFLVLPLPDPLVPAGCA